MSRLAGKTIVITGAGRGIGRAYALAMAAEGARIVVNDLGTSLTGGGADASPAESVVRKIQDAGGAAIANYGDVSDPQDTDRLVDAAVSEFGGLDAIVNNAAIEFRSSIDGHSAERWDRVMAVNARCTLNCVRSAAPALRASGGGTIINTTSGAFWEGTEGVAAYAASKAAVFALTLTQHEELFEQGIRSNCIAPNATRTRMVDSWISTLSKTTDRTADDIVAEYGIQSPENLAPLAIALCSDELAGLSGHVFEVWGERVSVIRPPRRGAGADRSGETWDVGQLLACLPGLVADETPA